MALTVFKRPIFRFTDTYFHSLHSQVHQPSLLPPLSHFLGLSHISPPALSPDAQHSATLGEASLGIMYFPSLSHRDILEWGERADLTEGLRPHCQLSLSLWSTHSPHTTHVSDVVVQYECNVTATNKNLLLPLL